MRECLLLVVQLCPLDLPLLLRLLELPAGTPLQVAPALLQQQELLQRELHRQQQEAKKQEQQLVATSQGVMTETEPAAVADTHKREKPEQPSDDSTRKTAPIEASLEKRQR